MQKINTLSQLEGNTLRKIFFDEVIPILAILLQSNSGF